MKALYPTAFPLKSYFELLEVLENVTFIFNGIDVENVGKVILEGNKVLIPIKTYRGDRAINIAVNKLY